MRPPLVQQWDRKQYVNEKKEAAQHFPTIYKLNGRQTHTQVVTLMTSSIGHDYFRF